MNDAFPNYYRTTEHRWADEDYLLFCEQELTRCPNPNDRPWWRESRIAQVSVTSQLLNGTYPGEFEPIKKERVE